MKPMYRYVELQFDKCSMSCPYHSIYGSEGGNFKCSRLNKWLKPNGQDFPSVCPLPTTNRTQRKEKIEKIFLEDFGDEK